MNKNKATSSTISYVQHTRVKYNKKSIVKELLDEESGSEKSVPDIQTNQPNSAPSISSRKWNNIIVIWLKSATPSVDENISNTMGKLQDIISSVEIFIDRNKCIDYLTDAENEKVFMIISQSIDRQFILLIETIPQLQCIYILREEQTSDALPIRPKGKVKGIYTSTESIYDRLSLDASRFTDDFVFFSIVSTTTSSHSPNELDQSFMYTQLIKEIILEIEYDGDAIKGFTSFCLTFYRNNQRQCEKVKYFEEHYKDQSPSWWYTKETFIYSLLNEALRTQNTKIIIKMAFFLRDLHEEIEQRHKKTDHVTKLIVYRGQGVLEIDFEKMKKNKGGLISFNSFLSTSIDREVSLMFADSCRQDADIIAILFRIEIDPLMSSISYAKLGNTGNFLDEEEILFAMNTIFLIDEMAEIDDHFWEISLIATSDNDSELKVLTEYMRNDTKEMPGWFRMAALLQTMGKAYEALEIYNILHESVVEDDTEEFQILQCGIESSRYEIQQVTGSSSVALIQAEHALEKYQQIYPPDHPIFPLVYSNLAIVHHSCGNYEEGLILAKKALEIWLTLYSEDDVFVGRSHHIIGEIHQVMGRFSLALVSYEIAYKIYEKSLPSNHPGLAMISASIGELHRLMGNYSSALTYVNHALEIGLKSLPPTHIGMFIIYIVIAALHQSLGSFSSALVNYEKALDICEKSLPLGHPFVGTIYSYMGGTHYCMNNYSLALSFSERALAILQENLPANRPQLYTCHINIGRTYGMVGSVLLAQTHAEKALQILQTSFPPDHLFLTECYISIADIYRLSGQYTTALSYLQKALKIQEKTLPENHPDFGKTYRCMALMNQETRNTTQIYSNLEKLLEIQQKHNVDNQALLSSTSNNAEAARQSAEYKITGFTQMKSAENSRGRLLSKVSDSNFTDNDISEFRTMIDNYSSGILNIEEALKIEQQLPIVQNPVFGSFNRYASEQTQLLDHGLNAISCVKNALRIKRKPSSNGQTVTTCFDDEEDIDKEDMMQNICKSLAYAEKALELQKQIRPPNDPFVAANYCNIGEQFATVEWHSNALTYFEKALAAIPVILSTNHPLYARTYSGMAKALEGLERYEEAVDYARRAVDVAHSSFDCSSDDARIYERQLHQLQRRLR